MSDDSKLVLPKQAVQLDLDPKPFKDLLSKEEDLKRVFLSIQDAIWRSFGRDIQREPFKQLKVTREKIKHRFKICEAWFRHARGDLGYSLEKTLDLMGQALFSELDGITFDPESGGPKIWTPT